MKTKDETLQRQALSRELNNLLRQHSALMWAISELLAKGARPAGPLAFFRTREGFRLAELARLYQERPVDVSFAHYMETLNLSRAESLRFLRQAKANGWTYLELRSAIRGKRNERRRTKSDKLRIKRSVAMELHLERAKQEGYGSASRFTITN